ncbi:RNA polymerase sigma factor [Aequorivita sp. Q41]|uniref:RNA polymerase sigma factor n=1 Tax=Aequorivita sp. Q41 TaxID=3153300 RepID=UPI003241C892
MQSHKKDIELDDAELVSKIVARNDTHLFAILYDRYAKAVYGKCFSFSKSEEEAQDLTHDIFIKLFLKLRTFKGDSKFSTWLYSFTYNFCLNYVTRDQKKKKDKFTPLLHENYNIHNEVPDEDIYQLKAEKLLLSLERIEPNDKMILLMKYQDDFTIQDLQKGLGIGESAVKMRLKRAKERLIQVYNEI